MKKNLAKNKKVAIMSGSEFFGAIGTLSIIWGFIVFVFSTILNFSISKGFSNAAAWWGFGWTVMIILRML